MNYTDLMSAFLVIFIILSAILYNQYKEQSEATENKYKIALEGLKQTGNDLDSLKYIVNRQKQSLDSLRQHDLKNQILRFRDVFPYNSYIKVDFDTIKGSIVLTPRNSDPKKDLFALVILSRQEYRRTMSMMKQKMQLQEESNPE